MNKWEYVLTPHRLLMIRPLRKQAAEMRSSIKAYIEARDEKINICLKEIHELEEEQQRKSALLSNALHKDLRETEISLTIISNDIVSYFESSWRNIYLVQIKQLMQKESEIYTEYYNFLTSQMTAIGDEINLLKERQNGLTSLADVKDIIFLSAASGYELGVRSGDDAKTLLDKVTQAIDRMDGKPSAEKSALIRLKEIVMERSDFLYTCKYIKWLIQQKIQFSKLLLSYRNELVWEQSEINHNISALSEEIDSSKNNIEELKLKIRSFFKEKKSDILNKKRDIRSNLTRKKHKKDELYQKIDEKNEKSESIQNELDSMKRWKSNDSDKWNRLINEKQKLSAEKNSLFSEIDSLKVEIGFLDSDIHDADLDQQHWESLCNKLYEISNKYGAPLEETQILQDNKIAKVNRKRPR